MELNIDVVCNDTGEVLKEGVSFESAIAFITEKEGKIVNDDFEKVDGSSIDDEVEIRTLWVTIPETVKALKKQEENWEGTKKFWNNWQKQRTQIIW